MQWFSQQSGGVAESREKNMFVFLATSVSETTLNRILSGMYIGTVQINSAPQTGKAR